jgi:hypothetical protein
VDTFIRFYTSSLQKTRKRRLNAEMGQASNPVTAAIDTRRSYGTRKPTPKNFYPHRVPLERNSQRRVSNGKKEGEKRVIG